MSYNKKQSLEYNIEAIKTALSLEKSQRQPTSAERLALSRYSGFGGLKCVLNPIDSDAGWSASELNLRPLVEKIHDMLRNESSSAAECQKLLSSLKNSVLTAFYTPCELVGAISDSIAGAGAPIGEFLDPSAGTGAFLDSFAKHAGKSTAFEKELLTGKILKALHPEAEVRIEGFETIEPRYAGHLDTIVSNIPFGDISVYDSSYLRSDSLVLRVCTKSIHAYFFAKGMDVLKDGGVLAFITTHAFLDSLAHMGLRRWLMERANLLSAIRLPNNLFRDIANTEVCSDLIVLQKNPSKGPMTEMEKCFVASAMANGKYWCNGLFDGSSTRISATTSKLGTDQYGKPAMEHFHEGGVAGIAKDVAEMLKTDLKSTYDRAILKTLPKAAQKEEAPKEEAHQKQMSFFNFAGADTTWNPPALKEREYDGEVLAHHKEGSLVMAQNGQIGKLKDLFHGEATFVPIALSEPQRERARRYITLRDIYEKLYVNEAENREEDPDGRAKLNEAYLNFAGRFGFINSRANAFLIEQDAGGRAMLSLERESDGKWVKSDIFAHPVSFLSEEITHVDTPIEALFASLNRIGQVDIGYMARLYGTSSEEIVSELRGKIYYDPVKDAYETADKFASGNVVEKARRIEEWAESHQMTEEVADSLAALKAATPRRITFEELDFNFGERWIDPGIYSRFATDLFGVEVHISYMKDIDAFSVQADGINAKITDQYAIKGENWAFNGIELLRHALVNTLPEITKKQIVDGEEVNVRDGEAIQLANAKIDEIRNAFGEWLGAQPTAFREELVDRYNELFNCYVRAKYDGSYQTFPGLKLENIGIKKLYRSQMDATRMILENGGGIVDHEVGTGKTLIICISTYEMKRLGYVNKPMIIAPKANVHDIAQTFSAIYPNAKILYPKASDFAPKNRTRLFNDIRNNSWDAVILSHEQFAKIPQSLLFQKRMIEEEKGSVKENLDTLSYQNRHITGRMRRGLEKRLANLESRLKKITDDIRDRTDDVVDFEMMGIDFISVDESHAFKNLTYTTRHDRVAGLGTQEGSQKAMNLLVAIRTIQSRTGRDLGATFYSGTTVSNSLTELYLLFKYLRPKEMECQEIRCFDAWAAIYAKKTTDFEFSITNEVTSRERFRYFIKVPELAAFYNEITDYRTAEDVGVDRPKMVSELVKLKPTQSQEELFPRMMEFVRTADGALLDMPPLSDSEKKAWMLILVNFARKMSLDTRMLDSGKYADEPDNKASVCAAKIAEFYRKYDSVKGTQFVFSDLGTYKSGEWNIYSEIKRKLVRDHGIPEYEVRFIQECKTESAKKKMIEAMNKGWIRVLFGSTVMLGTGINAQQRAVAIHHLDIPWRPSDFQQRNGRAVRKGNEVAKRHAGNKVCVFTYATEKTSDCNKFGILHNKQLFISQLKRGTLGIRTIDEGSISEDGSMSYAEWMAVLSGNTDLMDKAKLEKKISVLESEYRTYNKNMSYSKYKLQEKVAIRDKATDILARIRADMAAFATNARKNADGKVLNSVSLNGFAPEDSEAIGRKLQEINSNLDVVGQDREIGELYGFKLIVKTELVNTDGLGYRKANRFYVQGEHRYSYNNGIMAKDPQLAARNFLNALERMPKLEAEYIKEIDESGKDIPMLAGIVNTEWGKLDELKKLKAEHDAIERKIQHELNAKNIVNADAVAVQ